MIERIMVNFGIPFFVCVFLPVVVVWLIARTKQHETNRKAEIMLKAIEAGVPVDMKQFESHKKASRSIKQELLEKLNGACVTGLMGVAFLTLGIIRQYHPDFGGAGMMFSRWLLPAGAILLAVGVSLFVSYFAGKKLLTREIEAEEKTLDQSREQ